MGPAIFLLISSGLVLAIGLWIAFDASALFSIHSLWELLQWHGGHPIKLTFKDQPNGFTWRVGLFASLAICVFAFFLTALTKISIARQYGIRDIISILVLTCLVLIVTLNSGRIWMLGLSARLYLNSQSLATQCQALSHNWNAPSDGSFSIECQAVGDRQGDTLGFALLASKKFLDVKEQYGPFVFKINERLVIQVEYTNGLQIEYCPKASPCSYTIQISEDEKTNIELAFKLLWHQSVGNCIHLSQYQMVQPDELNK